MSTIETATGCRITVGPKGLALWDRSAHLIGYELSTPLTADERRTLADALVPGRDFSGVDWKVMYDQARSERDEWKQEHDLLVVHGSVRGDTYAAMVRDRDDWRDKAYSASEGMRKAVARAEAAEARTAPAVTKADIEKSVRGKVWAANRDPNKAGFHRVHVDWATDAVWSMLSGDDPAVLVVRESDIAAVEVERDSHGEWFADGERVYALGAADSRNLAGGYMQKAIRRLAVARAIEAEQDVDPVEDAAVAAFKAAWHRADEEGDEGNRVRRGIRAARDVLGQEDRHVDQ